MNIQRLAGIDVHKKMLAVVVADAAGTQFVFERCKFGTTSDQLALMREWLISHGVQEIVMESTAQYWKPVWRELEGHFALHLAQAHSNKAPKGRKSDFADAERLVKRLVAEELVLSYVPDLEQRLILRCDVDRGFGGLGAHVLAPPTDLSAADLPAVSRVASDSQHATRWSAISAAIGGTRSHSAMRCGHRGANRQPGGGSLRSGTRPSITRRAPRSLWRGSGGTSEGCTG